MSVYVFRPIAVFNLKCKNFVDLTLLMVGAYLTLYTV